MNKAGSGIVVGVGESTIIGVFRIGHRESAINVRKKRLFDLIKNGCAHPAEMFIGDLRS